ncbi:MAG: Trm112 family protein [Xanthomonadaceae bacterium]|jgi:uncharacterized protein YbaR (Trm112 family)|nr:Trm112 family protein [Xanthomonadaceae bacterium]
MDNKLLELLRSPDTHQPLRPLNPQELGVLNQAISAGAIVRKDGSPQRHELREALITDDRMHIYRIEDGIPVLLVEEAIATEQIGSLSSE